MHKYEDVHIPEPANLFDDYSTRASPAHKQEMEIDRHMRLTSDVKVQGDDWPKRERYRERAKRFAEQKLEGRELVQWKYQTYLKDFMRCTWAVDESVGRILDALDKQGLTENTIVFYCSDQGFYMGEHGWFDKRFMYEESFRTPLIARWPGKIKPGSVNKDLVQNIDFAETFLALAESPAPTDMQGENLIPLLKGNTPKDWRKSIYYHYYAFPATQSVRRHEGVFDGRWKLIRFYGRGVLDGEEWELYDHQEDPSEMNNIYAQPKAAEKAEELKKERKRLQDYYQIPTKPIAAN